MKMVHSNVPLLMMLKGIKSSEMVERTGIDRDTIRKARSSRIESCRLESLLKIATVLDVKVDYLFAVIEDRKFR